MHAAGLRADRDALSRRPAAGAAGLLFGGLALILLPDVVAAGGNLVVWAINELLFPLGCSVVLYAGEAIKEAVLPGPAAART